eukprot:1159548-Pelagomonas_calceolata.AAC.13
MDRNAALGNGEAYPYLTSLTGLRILPATTEGHPWVSRVQPLCSVSQQQIDVYACSIPLDRWASMSTPG